MCEKPVDQRSLSDIDMQLEGLVNLVIIFEKLGFSKGQSSAVLNSAIQRYDAMKKKFNVG